MRKRLPLFCALAASALAQDPVLSVQPSVSRVNPGQAFTVAVVVFRAQDLFAYQFDLVLPPGSVPNSITQGPFLRAGGTTFFVPGTPGGARPLTADTLIGPISGVNGSGTLATFGFTAGSAGPLQASLTNVILLNSSLSPTAAQVAPLVSCVATPNTLWPPNGHTVVVTVSGIVTAGTQPIPPRGTTYAVEDEYKQVQPSGTFALGAGGSYSFQVPLIAARHGSDPDGRQYTIVVSTADMLGNVGACSSVVTVPHDQGGN